MKHSYFLVSPGLLPTVRHTLVLATVFLTATLALFYSPVTAAAQESCGDFVYLDSFDEDYVEPVDDCSNPFGVVDGDRFSNVVVQIDGQVISEGDTLTYEQLPTRLAPTVSFDGDTTFTESGFELFYHLDGNYVSDYTLNVSATGTYTLVHSISEQPQQVFAPLEWLQNLFIKTAHAQFGFGPLERTAITFSVALAEPEPEPAGASSVLFLPGIMGSKLFEKGQQCGDFGEEQQRWFSASACEQLRLKTDFRGRSINDIYTGEDDGDVIDETLGLNLYKSFISEMSALEGSEIADFHPYAYDWRLRLDDLLKMRLKEDTGKLYYDPTTPLEEGHLYTTIKQLIEDSYSGKLTIVAHSNGGLLAKTFLSALQAADDPMLEKIDNLVLVGSPQVGTPDAVSSMLHGSSIAGGFIVTAQTSRTLLNTAPFGHHLLPNQLYFDSAGVTTKSPVVTFEPGLATDAWRLEYGESISDAATLHDFLSKNSGRTKPTIEDLDTPEVVDPFLLTYADTIADVQADWIPSADITVHQIAGTGVSTVSGVTYSTGSECVSSGLWWWQCNYEPVLKHTINHTYDGDQTVIVSSALAMKEEDNVERWWVDLFEYGDNHFINITHKNLMELEDIKDLIVSVVKVAPIPILEYTSQTEISLDIGQRLEFQLHSPLDMMIESSLGVVSSTTVSIPGATYRRYGEVQYISLPVQSEPYELVLRGYEVGSFTLDITERDGDLIINTYSYTAVPTGTSTMVSLPLADLTASSTLAIDYDGDGTIDGVVKAVENTPSAIEVMVPVSEELDQEVVPVQSGRSTSGTRVRAPAPVGIVAGVSSTINESASEVEQYVADMMRLLTELQILLSKLEKMYEN